MSSVVLTRSKDLTTNSIRIGYANALVSLGYEVRWLEPDGVVFDVFYDANPDLIIISAFELNRAIVRACKKYRPKIVLFLPTDKETKESDLVFTETLCEDDLQVCPFVFWRDQLLNPWQEWVESGLVPKITSPAADTIRFKQGKCREEFACDISYIGTWRPEKANLLRYLEDQHNAGYKVRIYGYGNWNHPLHVGAILSDEDYADAIVSSKTNILRYNMTDKYFKVLACGGKYSLIDPFEGVILDYEPLVSLQKNNYISRVEDILKCVKLA